MPSSDQHLDWLHLVEDSGPFLTLPVLERVFPQGLDARDPDLARDVKHAYREWRTEVDGGASSGRIHEAWVRLILERVLGYTDEVLVSNEACDAFGVDVPEHHERIEPNFLLRGPDASTEDESPRLAIQIWRADQGLEEGIEGSPWAASPANRMAHFCRASGIRLGLVTNGERWMLVNAPSGETTGSVSWYAHLWTDEPLALRSFRSLLSARRFFGVHETETLEGMLEASKDYQAEVTDRLGDQVRRAVEVLIEALDKADADTGRELLQGVSEERLYEAALTVMMRLVFLFCAEERGLLLLGDETYDQHYAVSTLGAQLREEADRHGIQVLEYREDAWSRLLATFRAIYGGVHHESLRLPAYGGSLFDPDRFPFLEGRPEGSDWRQTKARPLPIDNRTVLHLLDALQLLQMSGRRGRTEARKLSYASLDIEQIGYVYEGLLDHSAIRAEGPVLGLQGTKYKEPEIPLDELEEHRSQSEDELVDYLHDMTGRSKSALRKRIGVEPGAERLDALRVACGTDTLLNRVLPFQELLREDPWGEPIVIQAGSVYVTAGTERQATGTHYTPRVLTEEVVRYALEPVVYRGPVEGVSKEEWELKSAEEILDLKVCDPAMGSGAFLVQTIRWLSERLQEAWEEAAGRHPQVDVFGNRVSDPPPNADIVPSTAKEREVVARRLIAERCIHGVDVNPLAVEISKLSIWLITLAKDRPFSFLDHNLRMGDSLLGVSDLEQLYEYHPLPSKQGNSTRTLFDPRPVIEQVIREASQKRERIESSPVRDISDSQEKERLHKVARRATDRIRVLGNILTATAVTATSDVESVDEELDRLAPRIRAYLDDVDDEHASTSELQKECRKLANPGLSPQREVSSFFHWPLEYPEVFGRPRGGFDAIVMNPPFMTGRRISGTLSRDYREYLVEFIAFGQRGANADLSAYFLLRGARLLRDGGTIGSLATNSIAEGDTREVGLDQLSARSSSIFRAVRTRDWPGMASLQISQLWLVKGSWNGTTVLDDEPVDGITAGLRPPSRISGKPYALREYERDSFEGTKPYGLGFVLDDDEARSLISSSPEYREVVRPYLSSRDLYSEPDASPKRWILDFDDMSEEEAKRYEKCWEIAEERVKPYRLEQDAEQYPGMVEEWWKFWNQRQDLYRAIDGMERVIALGRVTKIQLPAFVETDWVYSENLAVFVYDRAGALALLSSSFHWWWGVRYGSTLRDATSGIRYSRSDCFMTFPQPELSQELDDLGEDLHSHRRGIMASDQVGLTDLYNRFHDPSISTGEIGRLRELHREIDRAVASQYGWSDLPLEYDFQETRFGPRYTWGLKLRTEILDRLLELNHARHGSENVSS